MAQEYLVNYRGEVRACIGCFGEAIFVTAHPENHPTAFYRLNLEKLSLSTSPLPAGGMALAVDRAIWVAGSDRRLYFCTSEGNMEARGAVFPEALTRLQIVDAKRLAVLTGSKVCILSREEAQPLQELSLPELGTALAVDPSGKWLVAGTSKGNICVFESETSEQFVVSEVDKLHDGPVTALLFEPNELRFYSAGADLKLLSTHARGRLEPEDRGRGNNHTEPITALINGPAERFYSGSKDSTVKAWPKGLGTRPVTLKEDLAAVVDLGNVTVHDKPHLFVVCSDNSLRLFGLDDEGKPSELIWKMYDAVARVKHELSTGDFKVREAALNTLAEFADTASIELVDEQSRKDPDHALRLAAAKLLAQSKHPRAGKLLEKGLNHRDEAIRVVAFHGLRQHRGQSDLRPIDLALKAGKADVGKLAVQALEPLAAKDDQALARLNQALNTQWFEVRQAALLALENVYPSTSPDADIEAFTSKHADLRRLALLRLYHRQMLQEPRVQAALRRRCEDADAEVRRLAFLLTLYPRPKLLTALRQRDLEMLRQLLELEHSNPDGTPGKIPETKTPAQTVTEKANLDDADFAPLLQATANQSLDTCLRGSRGLAVLRDPRAFGLLLQLSREPNAAARVDVCRAMAALDDPRAVNRLRSLLHDAEASVRDAAFSALAQILKHDPLQSAEAGLNAPFEDVRKRGLQVLVEVIRQSSPQPPTTAARALLLRALNDGFRAIRGEAGKSAMNLKIDGPDAATLRFLLQSIHADIRQEALTETMAQINEPWAWELLIGFFNDPEPKLRSESFEFAQKRNKEVDLLHRALKSSYVDTRLQAVEALIKKHSKAAQAVLVEALADAELDVRLKAMRALIDDGARPALLEALKSPHDDVRAQAASALARQGVSESLPVLTVLANLPQPRDEEGSQKVMEASHQVALALEGLGELGDIVALATVVPMLDHARSIIRAAAAKAVVGLATPESLTSIRSAFQHSDSAVRYPIALGLAIAGDVQAAPIVFSTEAEGVLSADERLIAAFTLGPAAEDQLVAFLDHADEGLRQRALLLQLLLEMVDSGGIPDRVLACLSSRMPRIRLAAAQALEAFADPATFTAFVVQQFNDRGDAQPFKIAEAVVRDVALLLAFGAPQTKARTARLLSNLAQSEQAAWNQGWETHAARYAAEINSLRSRANVVASRYTLDQLRQLAFGAYIGLIREQGAESQTPQLVIRVRQTALARVMALARSVPAYAGAARPVFVQALGDPNQPVRTQAFEHLQALKTDNAALGAEAIASGHVDLGIKGLQLLTAGASAEEGARALEQVMLTRTDHLAVEAANLLIERRNKIEVAEKALTAVEESLRLKAVEWLAAEYDKEPPAQKALRSALESRYQKVREAAALELGAKKDVHAFDALVKLLHSAPDGMIQRRAIDALVTLGDPRTPDAFLDRLENDPAGTALVEILIAASADFRLKSSADRLFALGERRNNWGEVYDAIMTISGFDQWIADPDDENPDRKWEKEQHPRHDDMLARLIEHALERGDAKRVAAWIPAARWARGRDVDPVLALLSNHADADLRNMVVEAIGWRLHKRQGNVEPLLKSLRHKDPNTQFLAAEGLARGGRAEGINVLFSAIEYLEDVFLRRRAVNALGELGDRRAFDLLLKLATEAGHALQEAAAEALGHLGASPQADEIFRLLERLAKGNDDLAVQALKGLRWLNTPAAWALIRQRAGDRHFFNTDEAVRLLGHNDDRATRDLILKFLASPDFDAREAALHSARLLWGMESLEPDYALLRSGEGAQDEFELAVKRVCERGEPRQIFEILPDCNREVQDQLANSLLNRPALPAGELQSALSGPDPRSVQLAAHLLGRHPEPPPGAAKAVETAIGKWAPAWNERRVAMLRQNRTDDSQIEAITPCLETLIWTGSRVGIGPGTLREIAQAYPDDLLYRAIRLAAVTALAAGKSTEAAMAVLETTATGNDAEARTLAVEALSRQQPKRAAAMAEKLLADRVNFNRLAAQGVAIDPVLHAAAGQVHYQGVVLPHLIKRKDFNGLAAVADNAKLPETTRLGAVEGLAMLADERAEQTLVELGKNEKVPEDLRKAAWKGLKRSRRARKQGQREST